MAAVTAAILIAAAVAAGTEGYNAYQASQDRDAAQNERGRQDAMAKKAADEAKTASDKQAADVLAAQNEASAKDAMNATRIAQQRRRNSYGSSLGSMKGGTILTGPQGLGTAPAASAPKTLLGE